jgi:hypothetical protein
MSRHYFTSAVTLLVIGCALFVIALYILGRLQEAGWIAGGG